MKISKRVTREQAVLRERLGQLLRERQARNPRYSLRALARQLKLGRTSLSDFLVAKRGLSPVNTRKVAELLETAETPAAGDALPTSEAPPPAGGTESMVASPPRLDDR